MQLGAGLPREARCSGRAGTEGLGADRVTLLLLRVSQAGADAERAGRRRDAIFGLIPAGQPIVGWPMPKALNWIA